MAADEPAVAEVGSGARDDLDCCEAMAHAFRALGNATRLGILRRIIGAERCVSELQEALDCSQPNVSQHLGLLRDRGLITPHGCGARVCYRPAHPRLGELLALATEIFEIDDTHAQIEED